MAHPAAGQRPASRAKCPIAGAPGSGDDEATMQVRRKAMGLRKKRTPLLYRENVDAGRCKRTPEQELHFLCTWTAGRSEMGFATVKAVARTAADIFVQPRTAGISMTRISAIPTTNRPTTISQYT